MGKLGRVADVVELVNLGIDIVSSVMIQKNTKRLIRQQIYAGIGMSILAMGVSYVQSQSIMNAVRKECEEVESAVRDTILRNTV